MNTMIRSVSSLTMAGILLFIPFVVDAAEEDWKKELLEEVVEVKNGKMTSLKFGLLSFPWAAKKDKKAQVRLYSEAPSRGIISRDNFVAITTQIQTTIFVGFAVRAKNINRSEVGGVNPKSFFDFNELEEPIGKVDIEVNIYMGKEGLQIEFVAPTADEAERKTITWPELLE